MKDILMMVTVTTGHVIRHVTGTVCDEIFYESKPCVDSSCLPQGF